MIDKKLRNKRAKLAIFIMKFFCFHRGCIVGLKGVFMKNKLKYLVVLCLALILVISSILPVAAGTTESSGVIVTEEMVIEIAERFAVGVNPGEEFKAVNPIKFYNEEGQAIGYIVDYYKDGEPSGYIIFDNTYESFISEYSFDTKAKNPYQNIVDSCDASTATTFSSKKPMLYKIGPLTYGIIDENACAFLNNYGEKIDVEAKVLNNTTNSKNPHTWNDVFLKGHNGVLNDIYFVHKSKSIPEFIAMSEETIEEKTGHYACAVSALLACAWYYGTANYQDIKSDYMELWNRTKTTTDHVGENGIIYGSTYVTDMGRAFKVFCDLRRDVYMNYSYSVSPSYSFFTDCIDSGNMAVFGAGINKQNSTGELEYGGHVMAVEGYATIFQGSEKILHTLMVFDGWNTYVRYVNLDFEDWVDTEGVTFTAAY